MAVKGSSEANVRKSLSVHELNDLTQSLDDLMPRDYNEIKCSCSSQTLCSLSNHLADRSYLLGFSLSVLDLIVSSHILEFERKNNSQVLCESKIHLQRWMNHVTHLLEEGEQFSQTSCQEVEKFLTNLNITCPQLVVEVENGTVTDVKNSPAQLSEDEPSRINSEEDEKLIETDQNEHNIEGCTENGSTEEDVHSFENGDNSGSENDQCEEENEGSDDEGWITPSNIKKLKEKSLENEEEEEVSVACMTADFAIQNVLKQIGLSVLGVDGKIIRHCKTYILRCHACFRTTADMSKVFCQKCGHKALKKVAVSLNPDGSQKIWISSKPINTKGMKFSLPTPKGGKHALNPVLVADQREAQKMASKLGRKKTDPLSEDYDASLSPFATRDVYSKAAQMGYRAGSNHTLKYWEQHNPNVPLRRTGKKKGK